MGIIFPLAFLLNSILRVMLKFYSSLLFLLFCCSALAQESAGWKLLSDGGRIGFVDQSGIIKIRPQFEDAKLFSQGLAAVRLNSLWGYVNDLGNIVVECQFDEAQAFSNHLAAVKKFGQWGFIDPQGKMVINYQFDEVGSFTDSLSWVQQIKSFGYIDKLGRVAIPLIYSKAGAFVDGLAPVARGGKVGFIDKAAQTKIDFLFDDALPFENGLAPVMLNRKWGFIDTKGNIVISYRFDVLADVRGTPEFAWAYADDVYKLAESSSGSDKKNYLSHLKKAIKLIDKSGAVTDFTVVEWSKLKSFYVILGDYERVKMAEAKITALQNVNVNNRVVNQVRKSDNSVDFSVATAPVKLFMRNFGRLPMHQIPLYAELRVLRFAMAFRYNEYSEYKDQFRFGAWKNTVRDSAANVYSGKEYSLIFKFLKKGYTKKGWAGYGYAGPYSGVELRYSDLNFSPVVTDLTPTSSTVGVVKAAVVSPQVKSYDICYNLGFYRSRGMFYLDVGLSFGFGYREYKMIDSATKTELNFQDYTFSDVRLKQEFWSNYYLPFRFGFRMGVNLF